ncbi:MULTISPECIES: arylsulfatase [unclassified Lentimonas]|uniref:sulfatase family protein n=1 Tax=unclassified Lentimonas TaxID=2630993 RepID=UPI001326F624|nr:MULTISPECIES: arylsulfatase [unclassified Lentimonas]CAA6690038.1 Unannotated [Lentimonas sp. CC10]CAA6691114.1 Unannotated [Lentimonas sp. CC19]CAA7069273.1 Unannotated [Lentimonas sp. CC11]
MITNIKKGCFVTVVFVAWAAVASSQTTLIDATFNDTDDGLLESFSSLDNGFGNPLWNQATGEASMSVDDPSIGTLGAVSDGSFDGTILQSDSSVAITFVVESITDPDDGPTNNGHWLGLQGNDSELWNNAEDASGNDAWAVGVRFLSGNVDLVYDKVGGNEVSIASLGTYTVASLQDGYTAALTFNEDGWDISITGIVASSGGTGSWPAGFDYSNLQVDDAVYAAMTYQQSEEAGTIVDLQSILVVGDNLSLPVDPNADSDGDDMSDAYESTNGLDPDDASDRNTDLDEDGLTNYEEFLLGTAANLMDTDKDGLGDYAEVNQHFTDPLDADSDDDFLNDSDELLIFRTDPNLQDSDLDGFDDGAELATLSNPRDLSITPSGQDSDEDGLLDNLEIEAFGNLDSDGLADNDGDLFPNIVEQAFGSLLNDAASIPQLNLDAGLELTFKRHLIAGVGYELLVSEDLKTWQSYLGYLLENASSSAGAYHEEASYDLLGEADQLFVKASSRTEIVSRPNIIVIYTDDQGFGDMGANNPECKFPTPALDQLAAQGINFTDGHTADTVCTPSRYALLTGRYPWRTSRKSGVLGADSKPMIDSDRTTLASLLRDHGYATAMIGKWHLGMDIPGSTGNRTFTSPISDLPLDKGFDYFYGIPASMNFGYLAWIEGRFTEVNPTLWTKKKGNSLPGTFNDYRITPPYTETGGLEVAPDFDDVLCLTRFTDKAIEWMRQQVPEARGGKPFFVYIPYTSSHKPVCPRDDFLGLSDAGAYGDFMMETDYHVGNILKFLDESGLANNTMVIFSSDNGPETNYAARDNAYGHDSAGIYRGGKRDVYEGGHRVPFVVRWPAGIAADGRVWDKPVCQTDLLATFADIIGVTLADDEGEDSVSFYDVLRDDSASPIRLPMIVRGETGSRYALRDGDWKLIMPSSSVTSYELYDLANDPTESNDLSGSTDQSIIDRIAAMEASITEIIVSGRTTPGTDVGNDTGLWNDLVWIP